MVHFKLFSAISIAAVLSIQPSAARDNEGYNGLRANSKDNTFDTPFHETTRQLQPNRRGRNPADFETITCVEPADDVEVCDSREGEGLGLFVCRSVTSPMTGEEVD